MRECPQPCTGALFSAGYDDALLCLGRHGRLPDQFVSHALSIVHRLFDEKEYAAGVKAAVWDAIERPEWWMI